MRALSVIGAVLFAALVMVAVWYVVQPPPPQPSTTVITCSTGSDASGFHRVRISARPGDCKLGAFWRDAEGQHECVESGRTDYLCRDCSEGCMQTIEEPVWCKGTNGVFYREGETFSIGGVDYCCARMDTWTVVREEPKP